MNVTIGTSSPQVSGGNGTTVVSASFTVAAGSLIVVAYGTQGGSSGHVPAAISDTFGGLTWHKVDRERAGITGFVSGGLAWARVGGTLTGTVTVTFAVSTFRRGLHYGYVAAPGAGFGDESAFPTCSNDGTASTLAAVFSGGAPPASALVIGAVNSHQDANNAVTPGANFSELADLDEGNNQLQWQEDQASATDTVDWSDLSAANVGVGVAILEAGGTTLTPSPITVASSLAAHAQALTPAAVSVSSASPSSSEIRVPDSVAVPASIATWSQAQTTELATVAATIPAPSIVSDTVLSPAPITVTVGSPTFETIYVPDAVTVAASLPAWTQPQYPAALIVSGTIEDPLGQGVTLTPATLTVAASLAGCSQALTPAAAAATASLVGWSQVQSPAPAAVVASLAAHAQLLAMVPISAVASIAAPDTSGVVDLYPFSSRVGSALPDGMIGHALTE